MKEQLQAAIVPILYKHDLMGLIGHGGPEDEYAPEARTIAERMIDLNVAEADMIHVVQNEFERWFGIDGTGMPFNIPTEQYALAAADIWAAHVQLLAEHGDTE